MQLTITAEIVNDHDAILVNFVAAQRDITGYAFPAIVVADLERVKEEFFRGGCPLQPTPCARTSRRSYSTSSTSTPNKATSTSYLASASHTTCPNAARKIHLRGLPKRTRAWATIPHQK
jgi:hypothetical protein